MRKRFSFLSLTTLIVYIAFVLCSTVVFREIQKDCKFDMHPFWSYKAILNGRDDLVTENILNVLFFMPLGFLLGATFMKNKWKSALLIGLCLSLCIETLQFVYSKGFTEFDDVMHNTLGCIIGYGLYNLTKYGFEKTSKRSKIV